MDRLSLRHLDLTYRQSVSGTEMHADIGDFSLEAKNIDLPNRRIDLQSLSLSETLLAYQQEKANTASATTRQNADPSTSEDTSSWAVTLEAIDLTDNTIRMSNLTQPRQQGAIDFNHLLVQDLNLEARNLHYGAESMQADLRNFTFREQSGFTLTSLEGKLAVTETGATLENFLLTTGNSRLQLQADATFPSFKTISTTWPDARFTSNITASHISLDDIRYLQPSLLDSLPLTLPPATGVDIDASLRGSVNDLTVGHLLLKGLSETSLRATGIVKGLPEAERLRLDLSLDKFYTTRQDLESILPDTLLPPSMRLPAWLNVKGHYQGTLTAAAYQTSLTSDAGGVSLKGDMDLDSASASRGINAILQVKDLNVGNILGEPDSIMGTLSMHAEAHMSGLTPDEMEGAFNAGIDHFDFQNYRYRDLVIDGTIQEKVLKATASMADKNLNFKLQTGYVFKTEVPRYQITLDVKNADFNALNFSSSPIRGRGILTADIATSDFQKLNGHAGIRKVAIFNGDDLYAIDSLLFVSLDQKGRSEINIDSDLFAASFKGSINIFSLPGVMRDYFNHYYTLPDSVDVEESARQHFTFAIDIKNTDMLTGLLVPGLTTFKPGEIIGEFDSEKQVLDIRLGIDEIQYNNIGITAIAFNTQANGDALHYNLAADKIMIDSMKIDGIEFDGVVANDSLRTHLMVYDSTDAQKYRLGGTFFSIDNDTGLKLLPEGIMLNYQKWSVPDTNYMRFGTTGFTAENVTLTHQQEKIIIDARPGKTSPVFIGFRSFKIEDLVSMIAEERPLSGLLEGDINLFPDTTGFTFTSDIAIADFAVRDVDWGDITLKVDQTAGGRFNVNLDLSGNQNNITLDGFYAGGPSPALNLNAQIKQFALNALQPLLVDQFQDIKGILSGEMRIAGTVDEPDIDGMLLLKDTGFFSKYLNTSFAINNETIAFNDKGITFDAFEIADKSNNKARLNGSLLTTNYRDYRFNLDLTTDHFRLLDTKKGDNPLFYGQIDLEAYVRIRGDMTTPVVDMEIGLSEGSDLTYVVPQSEASALATEGIVKFVDKTFEGDPFMQRITPEAADTVKSTFRGIDLTARVEVSDEENFAIVIDPVTQDMLTIKGNSTLTLKIDPSGDINLTGRFEISEGTYNLSFYKFVKREFAIESGSAITWSGDPLNAEMDIRAIYNVETAPLELFSNQLTGSDPAEVNRYKQRLPFLVYLNISGELLQPEIAFALEMPMKDRNVFGGNVYARIRDINTRESELNKQVFALLILKRFISDNPFENQAGGSFASTARRSVSKILSEQLNRLSENIKGVELSFDIKSYEDYTTGQAEGKTELELGFSKSLLNDRLVVKLSGNIDLEGHDTNRQATDYIGDLALEYKMTPDGRFRITGFRNSNYDMIDGELIETGAGLIYIKDYNSLSELFKANAKTGN